MAQMNISIPEKLKAYVEERVADGEYASTSDYLRDLVRQDQRRMRALEDLRAEIQAGIDSGVIETEGFAFLDELRAELRARAELQNAA